MRQLVYTMFISNSRALFQAKFGETEVSKYYANDCRSSFFLKLGITSASFKLSGKTLIFVFSETCMSRVIFSNVCRNISSSYDLRTINTENNLPRLFHCYFLEIKLLNTFISFSNLVNTERWKINILRMTEGLPRFFFKFKLFVILMKNLFIKDASCPLSETTSPVP